MNCKNVVAILMMIVLTMPAVYSGSGVDSDICPQQSGQGECTTMQGQQIFAGTCIGVDPKAGNPQSLAFFETGSQPCSEISAPESSPCFPSTARCQGAPPSATPKNPSE
jgi:hypothetical protein